MKLACVIVTPAVLLAQYAGYGQINRRPEFEVVSIKPSSGSNGAGCRGGPGTNDPGLFSCAGTSLTTLVLMADRVPYYQLSAPDSMLMSRVDVNARIPEGTSRDDFAAMIQTVLTDRFKVTIPRETRDIAKYDLVIAKNGPKFKEYVEPAQSSAKETPVLGALILDTDGYPVRRGKMTMAIMRDHARMHLAGATMEALAAQLSAQMLGPVTDSTGMRDKYDINLRWVTSNSPGTISSAPGGQADGADPGPTLPQALQDQLGLRLERSLARLATY